MVTILDTIDLVCLKNCGKKPNFVYDKLEHFHDASALIKRNSILEHMSDRHGLEPFLGQQK